MSEMKPIVKKVLESGLVDEHTVRLLEKFGNLPEGSAELVKSDALKDATRDQLMKLAEEIGTEVDKERTLKETQLDLDQLRWPKNLNICRKLEEGGVEQLAYQVTAVVDRMGRYYFRPQDIDESWLVPGYLLVSGIALKPVQERILEVSKLYIGDSLVCFQVSVAAC